MSNTASISFKTGPKIKKLYVKFAESNGLTPSGLLNIQMRQIIKDKKITISSSDEFEQESVDMVNQRRSENQNRSDQIREDNQKSPNKRSQIITLKNKSKKS